MTKRGKWLLAFGVTIALGAGGCVGAVIWADRKEAVCTSQVQAFEKSVQDNRSWTEKEIPGIGDYLEVHWLGKAGSDPCSRVPGPTDFYYQGFVRMDPKDAAALKALKEWQPFSPEEIWPGLRPFAPPSPQWMRARNDTAYSGSIYLDVATATLFFSLLHG